MARHQLATPGLPVRDDPLIRMRNMREPGEDKLNDIIKETKHGYIIKETRNGQADANGEFMFGAERVYLIENGEVKELGAQAYLAMHLRCCTQLTW